MEDVDKIAIVGIGCRFPGANNIKEFWKVLVNGENHVKEIPEDRWNLEAIYDPDPDAYGKTYVRKAGLLSQHDVWDNVFFGVAEKEASEMDPQQRYVLECVHMALEDGGIIRSELDGSPTSVFIGAMNSDAKTSKDGDYSLISNYTVTGDAASIITARVSYHYNLLGPSLTIDTACSSSLVAINLATQSLRLGESSMAICGGVNSILYPDMFVTLTKARMASPTGQCQAFSANADGYARGEGCGIVILERLNDAIKNDRHIWATISSGCNQDGQTAKPITAPSEIQQRRLLEDIYLKSYNIIPGDVQYIEAHGTGTPIGDPVEVKSLGSFFKEYPIQCDTLEKRRFIGSVKTNIGHLESGAGAASLIKTLLMMKHGKIVPSLHSLPRNPKIDFLKYALDVPTSVYPWPTLPDGSRAACINCFGFGGTNSHAFVRQWVEKPIDPISEINNIAKKACVPVSAKSKISLVNSIKHLVETLPTESYVLKELAYTASCKRDHHRYRKLFFPTSITDLIERCKHSIDKISNSAIAPGKNYRVVYVFCGVGTAWTKMGMELVRDFPVFADTLRSIDTYLMPLTGWSMADKIRDGSEMDDPFISHLGIFACQIGLSKFWIHWGICPDAIVGQSVGEVAAAYIGGVLSLRDAVNVIYHRSRLLAEAPSGRMAVIRNISTSLVAQICSKVGHVNIAVHSSPVACTISGEDTKVREVKILIGEYAKERNEIPLTSDLKIDYAYHSRKVENAAQRIKKCLEQIETCAPKVPIFSTVTGETMHDFGTPGYWQKNVAEPVLFDQALQASTNQESTIFLEIGPKPVLKAHLNDIFQDKDVKTCPSMTMDSGSSLLHATLSDLYGLGINPLWENIVEKTQLTNLPNYKFEGNQLLVESDYRFLRKQGLIDESSGRFLLLTQQKKEGEFKVNFSPDTTPFVYDHVIDNAIIIPGAIYTEVALELGMSVMDKAAHNLHVEYEIIKAIPLSKGKPSSLDLTCNLTKKEDGLIMFSVTKDAVTVAKGTVTNCQRSHKHYVPIDDVCLHTGKHIECEELYKELAKHGYKYGTSVQILESITFNNEECTGFIQLTKEVAREINQTSFHPAILDAMFHSSALSFLSQKKTKSCKIYPIRVGSVSVFRPFEQRMVCYTRIIQQRYDRGITNIILTRLDGLVLAEIKEIEHQIMDGSIGVNDMAYQIIWKAEELPAVISDSTDKPEQNVTICYADNNIHKILRTRYPHGESFRLQDLVDGPAFVMSGNMDTLIFNPISSFLQQNQNSDNMFNNVCKNCEAFLHIMHILKDMDTTVIIITENTQIYGSETDNIKNVFGAELWGFTRSLRHERTKCRLILIDVQPSIAREAETLFKAINGFTSDISFSFTECIIIDGQLHSNFVRRRPQSGLQIDHRVLPTDTQLDLQLRSTLPERIESPFLIPGERLHTVGKNEVSLRIEEIYIHSQTENRVTELDSTQTKSLWSDYKLGYPVIGLEFQGQLLDGEKSRRVVACYPIAITNRVAVPVQCVCDIGSLPMYTPGHIITSMLMWSLAQRVRPKSKVFIVTESIQPDDIRVILLRDILKTVRHSKVEITQIDALNDNRELEIGVFVLLEKYSKSTIERILRPGDIILGYDNDMLCLSNHAIQLQSKRIDVQIISRRSIFEKNNIKITFPKVTRWLKRWRRKHELPVADCRSLPHQTIKLPEQKSRDKVDLATKANGDKIIRYNATYVVVGGLSGLGWEVVKWLGQNGAGIVVPLSRTGNNPQMNEKLQNAMDIHKYKIVPMRCDVANYADVEKTFSSIEMQFPNHPIKGIFQGAGVLRDTRIENMTMDKFKEVLKPKVLGSWNLHLVSEKLPLDFFVMHSSTTSVFGNAGQTNYGAANAFLDTLAMHRRSKRLPGQSINWGALAVGMASNEDIRQQLEAHGYYTLDTEQIRHCLMDSLIQNQCQVIYGLFDWKIIEKNPVMMRTSNFEKEQTAVLGQSQGKMHIVNSVFNTAQFIEMSREDQRIELAHLLFSSISRVLSIDEKELEENQNLVSQGMESQKAVELIQMINEATGCLLPVAYILSTDYTIGMFIDLTHSSIIENINDNMAGSFEIKAEVDQSPSWMQKFYIDMYESNSKDSSLWFSIDFKLGSGLSDIDMWRTVLRWTTIRYPELRTIYQPTRQNIRFGIKKTVLDPEDAKVDLRVVDTSVLTREWTDQDICNYCLFDITKDPPIRALYVNTGQKHRIRFVMSHVTFDLQSFFTLLPRLSSDLKSYAMKKDIVVEQEEVQNLVLKMEKQLDLVRLNLETFWKGELNKIHIVPSFGGRQTFAIMSQKTEQVSLKLTTELVDKINNNVYGITPSTLLFSLYQILLFRMMRVYAIPVVMTVDMRRYFPEFNDKIFLGTNYVPVITEFHDADATLRECLSLCSNQVTLATAHSLYPFLLIKQCNADVHNCFRHFFNVRDVPYQDSRNKQYRHHYMQNAGYITGFLNQIETALNVVTDRHAVSMDLVLSYNPEILNSATAQNMVDDLSLLAGVAVTNLDFQLNEIPLACCVTCDSVKIDKYLSKAKFVKETSQGWEHPGHLKIGFESLVPQITWSNSDSNKTSSDKAIKIPTVLNVDIGKLRDSWCLIIWTNNRQYCFKSDDYLIVQTWRARIRKLMSRSKRSRDINEKKCLENTML